MIEFQFGLSPHRTTAPQPFCTSPIEVEIVDSFSFVTDPAHFEKCLNNLAITHLSHKAGFVLHTHTHSGGCTTPNRRGNRGRKGIVNY